MGVSDVPLFDDNSPLQRYYNSLESRIGYRLILGGTRHFGYYRAGTKWPFPIEDALRRMEGHMYCALNLPQDAKVLDAGCGVGHVAITMAKLGLRVVGIDIVKNHITWAKQEIERRKLGDKVSVRLGDYHHLEAFDDESFDGVYTMETFVHATSPKIALQEFFRVLKPGGSIALYEYDHPDPNSKTFPSHLAKHMEEINERAAMPSNTAFTQGTLQRMLENEGYQNVVVKDLSQNVKPMLRLFFLLAYIPYIIICFFGLQRWFVNTQAGVEGYRVLRRGLWRFVAVTARKPHKSLYH